MRAQARHAVAFLAVAALALAAGAAPEASADVCVVVVPVVAVGGCNEGSAAPSSRAQAQQQQREGEERPYRLSSIEPKIDPEHLAVTFRRGTTRRAIEQALANAGVVQERAIPPLRAYLVRVEPSKRDAALAALRSARSVAHAGEEPLAELVETTPNDTAWPGQTGLRVAGFPRAWDITRGSSNVVVAVVDTGVDPAQSDLQGALVPGYDFVNGDADPRDDEGHGTAVAGIIAARSNNRQGVTGVCWSCSIMPVKVLDANGVGDDTVIAAGVVWAVNHGADVVNLSLGGPGTTPDLTAALAYAVRKGAIVIAAAGNSGTTTRFYPAADPNVLSVAATTSSDAAYSWSNYGDWVDVAAPGCNLAPVRGGGVGNFCGTSSAAPVVAGLVALARSVDPSASAAVVRSIESTASPLPSVVRYGRINAAQALTQLRGAAPSPASTVAATFRGSLDARHRSRSSVVQAGAGEVTATLRFTGARSLTLVAAGATATGSSPVVVHGRSSGGAVRFVVRGSAKRARFVLRVAYVAK